jgi:Holliday junction resolvasome RuvABC endonuclease subunit
MTFKIKVAFLDPSHSNLGVARALVDPKTLGIEPIDISLVQTEKDKSKKVRVSSDDFSRAVELANKMQEVEAWADIIMAEIPSGSQSARSCTGAGICVGLLAYIRKPLIQVTPAQAKKVSVGRATGTKDEIIDWAYALYPNLQWIKKGNSKRVNKLIDSNEHMADAIAIGHAGVKTTEFRAAASMLVSLNEPK